MLEEYQAVTSPTVKRRPFPAAGPPAPPGDGVTPPLAVMAPRSSPPPLPAAHELARARARGEIWGGGDGNGVRAVGWVGRG